MVEICPYTQPETDKISRPGASGESTGLIQDDQIAIKSIINLFIYV
jgi:hypothetical protein